MRIRTVLRQCNVHHAMEPAATDDPVGGDPPCSAPARRTSPAATRQVHHHRSPVTASIAQPPAASVRHRLPSGTAAALAVVLIALAGLVGHAPWTALLLLVIAPVLEEVVFRAGLQDWLLRQHIRPLISTVGSAMAFALVHGLTRSWLLAAWVFVPALVLGAVYARKRRLGPVVVLHSAMNLVWLWAAPAWTGLSPTTPS